jgi:hypothetical protein
MFFPSHYKKNKTVELPAPYLSGQSIGVLNDMKYGLRTVGDVGCGALALYNAMRYKGLEPDLPKIIRYLELAAAPIGAVFGTFPFSMGYSLRHFGVKNKMTLSFRKLEAAESCVIAYWTKRPVFSGGHFVFCVKQEDGTYLVHNRWSNVSEPRVCKSLREVVKKHCLIVGYVLK